MIPAKAASPNFGPRKNGLTPRLVVLHFTAMQSATAAIERLCDPAAEVSAHYVIASDGNITQLVEEEMRAWHAGAGAWAGVDDINSRSIGIELDNRGDCPFGAPLMNSLETLLGEILSRWAMPAQNVIGHSDMAPARKFDPGARFDWQRLARLGLSIWPEDLPDINADWDRFCSDAVTFGYSAPTQDTLCAFRMRFLPGYVGELSAQDCRVMAALARDFPAARLDASLTGV